MPEICALLELKEHAILYSGEDIATRASNQEEHYILKLNVLTFNKILALLVDVLISLDIQRFYDSSDPSDEAGIFADEEGDILVHFRMNDNGELHLQLVREFVNELQDIFLLLAVVELDGPCQPVEQLHLDIVVQLNLIERRNLLLDNRLFRVMASDD